MKLSQAIYRLSKLARLLDMDGGEDDVAALNMAVDVLTQRLRDDQSEAAKKHVVRPIVGRGGNVGAGLLQVVLSRK